MDVCYFIRLATIAIVTCTNFEGPTMKGQQSGKNLVRQTINRKSKIYFCITDLVRTCLSHTVLYYVIRSLNTVSQEVYTMTNCSSTFTVYNIPDFNCELNLESHRELTSKFSISTRSACKKLYTQHESPNEIKNWRQR